MPNTLTNVTDKILAQGLEVLREAAIMPRLVNVDYMGAAAQYGTTVDVPVTVAQVASTVAASNTLKAAASKTPGLVQVKMDQWKISDFHMTDKEMAEIDRNRHFVPGQTGEAARALANAADTHVHAEYKGVYGYVGTASVVPFSTLATTALAGKVLNEQLAPKAMRRIVMDPTAEAQALQLAAYRDVSQSTDGMVILEGIMGRKMAFDHYMSQNVQTHTAGTASSAKVASTTAIGATTLGVKAQASAQGGNTILFGDVFTIAGDSQTYVYNSSATITLATALTQAAVTIAPTLQVIASANSIVTFKRSHVVNLAFHRNAFAFVTRPLAERTAGLEGGNMIRTMTDNVSGITLRLEIVRQHKQDAWQFDMLYGAKLVRAELAARIAG